MFRILRLSLIAYLEIEARTGQGSGVAHRTDPLRLAHVVALLHEDLGDVSVQRVVLVAVVQDDEVAVPLEPSRVHDVARVDRRDVHPSGRLDVHAIAEGLRAEPRMHLGSERADDAAVRRPRQPSTQLTESHARRVAGRARRWDLGEPSLLGLQVTDEGLEPTRGLGELPHHALVIGTLVSDAGEENASPGGVPVDLGLLPLGLGAEGRELVLPRLLPFFSIRKVVRSHTILSNDTGVQTREAAQMPDHGAPSDGIGAGEAQRQGRPLGVDLVERAQPSGQGLLLPAARRFPLGDLAAQAADLGLDTLDTRVEPDDLLLLVRESTIDLLELREEGRLLAPGLGRLLALLPQLRLSLFELAPLALERVVPLRRLGKGRERRRREQQRDDDARSHRPGPRASQPPKPPSSVPATTSTARFRGDRKVRAGRPMVTLRTGSR